MNAFKCVLYNLIFLEEIFVGGAFASNPQFELLDKNRPLSLETLSRLLETSKVDHRHFLPGLWPNEKKDAFKNTNGASITEMIRQLSLHTKKTNNQDIQIKTKKIHNDIKYLQSKIRQIEKIIRGVNNRLPDQVDNPSQDSQETLVVGTQKITTKNNDIYNLPLNWAYGNRLKLQLKNMAGGYYIDKNISVVKAAPFCVLPSAELVQKTLQLLLNFLSSQRFSSVCQQFETIDESLTEWYKNFLIQNARKIRLVEDSVLETSVETVVCHTDTGSACILSKDGDIEKLNVILINNVKNKKWWLSAVPKWFILERNNENTDIQHSHSEQNNEAAKVTNLFETMPNRLNLLVQILKNFYWEMMIYDYFPLLPEIMPECGKDEYQNRWNTLAQWSQKENQNPDHKLLEYSSVQLNNFQNLCNKKFLSGDVSKKMDDYQCSLVRDNLKTNRIQLNQKEWNAINPRMKDITKNTLPRYTFMILQNMLRNVLVEQPCINVGIWENEPEKSDIVVPWNGEVIIKKNQKTTKLTPPQQPENHIHQSIAESIWNNLIAVFGFSERFKKMKSDWDVLQARKKLLTIKKQALDWNQFLHGQCAVLTNMLNNLDNNESVINESDKINYTDLESKREQIDKYLEAIKELLKQYEEINENFTYPKKLQTVFLNSQKEIAQLIRKGAIVSEDYVTYNDQVRKKIVVQLQGDVRCLAFDLQAHRWAPFSTDQIVIIVETKMPCGIVTYFPIFKRRAAIFQSNSDLIYKYESSKNLFDLTRNNQKYEPVSEDPQMPFLDGFITKNKNIS